MKRKLILVMLVVVMLVGTGCQYWTDNAIIVDDNWNSYISFRIAGDSDFGPNKEEFKDIVDRVKLFYPELESSFKSNGNYVEFKPPEPKPISDIPFITKKQIDKKTVKLEIEIPKLITNKDYEGNPAGAPMSFQLFLPGKIIEANTINYKNDYTMKSTLKGKKRARVYWKLTPRVLSTPTKLWVKLKVN